MAVQAALSQLGTPYQHGGSGPGGFDCSGLTSWAYGRAGLRIPRTAAEQWRLLDRVRGRWRVGDILVFYNGGHVGLYVGRRWFIHSPHTGSRVQLVKLRRWYMQHLTAVVRVTKNKERPSGSTGTTARRPSSPSIPASPPPRWVTF